MKVIKNIYSLILRVLSGRKSDQMSYVNDSRISREIMVLAKNLSKLISNNNSDNASLLYSEISELPSENRRFQYAEALSMAIYPKYKFSEYGRIYLEDEGFIKYYEKIMDKNNWHSLDRKYTLDQLLKLCIHLQGDLVECGTYKGASAYLMCIKTINSDKSVHLFDSFEGLSEPDIKDGKYWSKGSLKSAEEDVRNLLSEFNNYHIYKGWIPERFNNVSSRKFCFLHIDVDLYQPTLESLKFFYDRMVKGSVILLDDYGFNTCPGAKSAADSFFSDKPEEIISLPTGQAFIVKL